MDLKILWNNLRISIEIYFLVYPIGLFLIFQASAHPNKLLAVLESATNCELKRQTDFNRSERVKPFVCQNGKFLCFLKIFTNFQITFYHWFVFFVSECNKYFYVPEAFFVHLKMKHSTISVFKCHLCKILSYSPEQLILVSF